MGLEEHELPAWVRRVASGEVRRRDFIRTMLGLGLSRTDPWTEVDGERSSMKVLHPFFTDIRVRQAFAVAIDRRTIAEQLYGAEPLGFGALESGVLVPGDVTPAAMPWSRPHRPAPQGAYPSEGAPGGVEKKRRLQCLSAPAVRLPAG